MLYIFDITGTAIFAVTALLAVRKKKLDLFGGIVIGVVTALGGGSIRDVLLGAQPVFWVKDTNYIIAAVAFAVLTFFLVQIFKKLSSLWIILDAFGLSVFTAVGVQKGLDYGTNYVVAVAMGVITGVAGGMIRDLFVGHIPLILRREIYATAAIAGALGYIIAHTMHLPQMVCAITAILITFLVRILGVVYNVSLPSIKTD
jgi:uncharacterized membrane protein YeiH